MRLLVFELHHLGDAVIALPFLRSAVRRFDVTVVCTAPTARLLSLLIPEVKILVAAKSWPERLWQAFFQLRRLKPDAAACVWSDARVALLMRFTGAAKRVGFPMTERNYYASLPPLKERNLQIGKVIEFIAGVFGPLFTQSLHRHSYRQSHLQDWTQLATAFGLETDTSLPWFDVSGITAPQVLQAHLAKHPGKRLVVVHPGARLDTKRWPMERFEQLLENQLSREVVAIIKPPGEPFPKSNAISHLLIEPANFAEMTGILNLANVVICNDSLAGHLAAGLGKRVITIFGSTDPAWFAPFNNGDLVVRCENDSNAPYQKNGQKSALACLQALTSEDVATKLPAH